VAIIGDAAAVADRFRWLQKRAPEIREELAKRIVLKFLPHLTSVLDKSSDRVARLLRAMDEVEQKSGPEEGSGHG